jgi:tRNA-2-methylthio-N6-dimethylallyladenosine synthase
MKYYVRTYGCQMNVADSDEMSRHLEARGLVKTDDAEDASIYLVNTCTVRQHAEDRALSEIGRLRDWKQKGPDRKVVITGCAAERTKEFLEHRFPYIDLVIGAKSIESFGDIVDGLLEKRPNDESFDYATGSLNRKFSTFVTIMRGCNYSCAYCIVPYVRGRESYRPIDEILEEVSQRVHEGVCDVTLLGQTVNSYHRDQTKGRGTDFADLLEGVGAIDGLRRIRFMSPHPFYMTDRVIGAMAELPAVCEGLHLPVQSGSNPMLNAMRRNYTREQYFELLGKLRRAMPGITLSTDVIVGFPGESEDDFAQTLSLLAEARFDWGFIFKYSPRQGTPAAEMESHPESLIEERHQICLDLVETIGKRQRQRFIGTTQEVLFEEDNFGRTRGNYKVRVEGDIPPGETINVQIANADRATLEGTIGLPVNDANEVRIVRS